MRTHKMVSKEVFTKIKKLYDAGLKTGDVVKYSGRSRSTVYKAGRASSWEHYKEILRQEKELFNKRHVKVEKVGIVTKCVKCGRDCKSELMLSRHYKTCKEQLPLPTTPKEVEKTSDTPMYDVLVEIRDLMKQNNEMIAAAGRSKGFRLW